MRKFLAIFTAMFIFILMGCGKKDESKATPEVVNSVNKVFEQVVGHNEIDGEDCSFWNHCYKWTLTDTNEGEGFKLTFSVEARARWNKIIKSRKILKIKIIVLLDDTQLGKNAAVKLYFTDLDADGVVDFMRQVVIEDDKILYNISYKDGKVEITETMAGSMPKDAMTPEMVQDYYQNNLFMVLREMKEEE